MSSKKPVSNEKEKKSKPFVVKAYLVLYNLAAMAGWGVCLVMTAKHIFATLEASAFNPVDCWGKLGSLAFWKEVEFPLKVVQTAAVMEVLHNIFGLVPGSAFTTFMQVFSRVWTLWAVMDVETSCQACPFVVLAVGSWSLVEVPRYCYYALNLLEASPYPLTWLRYSLFAVLYPTGISGELGCMYVTAMVLGQKGKDKTLNLDFLPNTGFEKPYLSLYLLILIVVATYLPGSPFMYMHMVKARGKSLQKEKKE